MKTNFTKLYYTGSYSHPKYRLAHVLPIWFGIPLPRETPVLARFLAGTVLKITSGNKRRREKYLYSTQEVFPVVEISVCYGNLALCPGWMGCGGF